MAILKFRTPGSMPTWQRWSFGLVFSVCFLSGLIYLMGNEGMPIALMIGHRELMTTHGISSSLLVFLLGTIFVGHVKVGWILKKNTTTGVGNLLVLSLLTITGWGLYYGSENLRDTTVLLHWTLGIGMALLLSLHLLPHHN